VGADGVFFGVDLAGGVGERTCIGGGPTRVVAREVVEPRVMRGGPWRGACGLRLMIRTIMTELDEGYQRGNLTRYEGRPGTESAALLAS